jgi:hypothetical protein
MAKQRILGIVRDKQLRRLTPIRDLGLGCRLSREAANAAAPERGEIDLSRYEGSAILVEGEPRDFWVYSASVIEQGGPIVTELVQYVLGDPGTEIELKPHIAP